MGRACPMPFGHIPCSDCFLGAPPTWGATLERTRDGQRGPCTPEALGF